MEGDRDDYLFLDECSIYIFFQLPKLNEYCLGVQLDPAHLVIKKSAKWIIYGATSCIPFHAATATEYDKKKQTNKQNKKGMPVTEILNACTR